jgi:hypothetical protein
MTLVEASQGDDRTLVDAPCRGADEDDPLERGANSLLREAFEFFEDTPGDIKSRRASEKPKGKDGRRPCAWSLISRPPGWDIRCGRQGSGGGQVEAGEALRPSPP